MADETSILSNPIFNAVGAALGVGSLFEGAGGGPGGPPPSAPPVKTPTAKAPAPSVEGSKTPREFRQHAPVAKQPAAGRGSQPGGVGMNLPGVMSPDVLQHPMVQALLNQYGVDPDTVHQAIQNADPNLFVSPHSAFGMKHPGIAGAVERGLEGLAFTPGTSATPGDLFHNVAQGMLDAKAARADKYNNQLMMPFAQAQQVANLKTISDDQHYKQAQAQHYQDLEEHYTAMDDNRKAITDLKTQQASDQNEMKNMQLVQKYQHDFGNVGANEDERAAWEQEWAKAGNDPAKLDPAALGNIVATAKERRNNELEAGKTKRTGIMAGASIKGKQITQESKVGSKGSEVNKAAYTTASKAEAEFMKSLNQGVATDADGNMVVRGTNEAAAAAKRYHDATESARQKWEKDQTMALPGTGMTQPKAAKAKRGVYNIQTGQIEYK
jgi:hypothetical protein